jgi:hypothetical protein
MVVMLAQNVLHFPVDRVMSQRIAEEKLGSIVMYRYPPGKGDAAQEWLNGWMRKKTVLVGWECMREGIARSFKNGRVRHIVSAVNQVDTGRGRRPSIGVLCSNQSHHVFNWCCEEGTFGIPVVVLSLDQQDYFRPCKRCEAIQRKNEQSRKYRRLSKR